MVRATRCAWRSWLPPARPSGTAFGGFLAAPGSGVSHIYHLRFTSAEAQCSLRRNCMAAEAVSRRQVLKAGAGAAAAAGVLGVSALATVAPSSVGLAGSAAGEAVMVS